MARKKRLTGYVIFAIVLALIYGSIALCSFLDTEFEKNRVLDIPQDLEQYMACINSKDYEKMYSMLCKESQELMSLEDFIQKNSNIYAGINASDVEITITDVEDGNEQKIVNYQSKMNTLAGEITFSGRAIYLLNEEPSGAFWEGIAPFTIKKQYKLFWYSQLIFPSLSADDKVRVNKVKAERGEIYDRNGQLLAGKGVASSVGFVPGKMGKNKDLCVEQASQLLGISTERIWKKLNASYVKDDTFVSLKTMKKFPEDISETEWSFNYIEDSADVKDQEALLNELLKIPGIKVVDVPVRYYPMQEKASHLTGYVQNVTAEDLEKLSGKGYSIDSVIGKSGLEKILEERLKGVDGVEIIIIDKYGEKKETIASTSKLDGENIKLTIDIFLQEILYNQLSGEKSTAVAMNPLTGEVLALISTPSYNANDFILGMSQEKWDSLNQDERKPLYNRFRATLVPGSGFKSVIAAIGLTTNAFSAYEDFGRSGRSWQKDASWGRYKITTVSLYNEAAILKNALIYSDNIYFAKAALRIGADTLQEQLLKIGFDERIPFEYGLYSSLYSATEKFDSEIQLADSGYGQAQILVNPIHMASIYTAFLNEGNMLKPCLFYENDKSPEIWKENAFTKEAAETVKQYLVAVAERSYKAVGQKMPFQLAGKTGTAEIKASKEDRTGTELGWFNVFTVDRNEPNPILIITMIEDVKNRGGSGYVIPKVNAVLQIYSEYQ